MRFERMTEALMLIRSRRRIAVREKMLVAVMGWWYEFNHEETWPDDQ
jgi:hypothetical protein